MSTDRIQKQILLRASRDRVWHALTDSEQFGDWFGMKLEGPFVAGQAIHGVISGTKVNPEVAAMQEPYAGKPVEFLVETIEPQRLFSLRWHPFAIEVDVDYSSEPTTLIEFTLEEKADGILLTVAESGFDNIPIERRARAFSANEGGWTIQMTLIEAYIALHP